MSYCFLNKYNLITYKDKQLFTIGFTPPRLLNLFNKCFVVVTCSHVGYTTYSSRFYQKRQ